MSTLASPVLPDTAGAGSVESLVWSLTRGLVERGHEVTVFGAAGSDVAGQLVATLPGPYADDGAPGDWHVCEWVNLCRAVESSGRFDVLHSHAYLWGLPLSRLSRAPMVHTLHVWPYEDSALLWRSYPEATVTAVSAAQWGDHRDLVPAAVIHHGVDPHSFTPSRSHGGYACFLGRFIPGKGPLQALAAARAAGMPLVLAGPPNDWFSAHVQPLVDGRMVRYAGPVSADERSELLGNAAVVLAPFQAAEPFCLVLVEAMMCGTPVVTTRLGAAPELVEEGVTGFAVRGDAELAAAVEAAAELDRRVVRRRAEERFSVGRMVDQYIDVYEKAVAGR